jgi:hypothetical protein
MKDSEAPMKDYYDNITSDPETALERLNELRRKLEEDHGMREVMDDENTNKHSGVGNYYYDQTRILYQQVMSAILELRNFHVRQALSDHKSFFESFNIIKNGISGNMMDNAGNFGNQMLNQITSLALEGYQNARDAAYSKLNNLRLKTE